VAHSPYESDWSNGRIQPQLKVLFRLADLIDDRAEKLARILAQREAMGLVAEGKIRNTLKLFTFDQINEYLDLLRTG